MYFMNSGGTDGFPIRGVEGPEYAFSSVRGMWPKSMKVLKLQPALEDDMISLVKEIGGNEKWPELIKSPSLPSTCSLQSLSLHVSTISDKLVTTIDKSLPCLLELELEDRPWKLLKLWSLDLGPSRTVRHGSAFSKLHDLLRQHRCGFVVRAAMFGALYIILGKRVWFFPNILAEEATLGELFRFWPKKDEEERPKWTTRLFYAIVAVVIILLLRHHAPDEAARARYQKRVFNIIDDVIEWSPRLALSGMMEKQPTVVNVTEANQNFTDGSKSSSDMGGAEASEEHSGDSGKNTEDSDAFQQPDNVEDSDVSQKRDDHI